MNGKKIELKLMVLIGFFLVTCVFVYGFNQPGEIKRKPPLTDYFREVDGYKNMGFIWMSDHHVNMLELDDYMFANYRRDGEQPNLYIGYYYSADKAYSAHSPTVCYPAQGWKVDTDPVVGSLNIGPFTINYEEIVSSHGKQRELVLYWYQSHLSTNTQVYLNKIDMAYNKLVNNDQQHAFVRVAMPFVDAPYEKVKAEAVAFIHAFYPQFVEFIKAEVPVEGKR